MTLAQCIVLGIDQSATSSGWAITDGKNLIASGVARNAFERQEVIGRALDAVSGRQIPLLVVFEDHSKMPLKRKTRGDRRHRYRAPERSTAVILGMGGARDRWHEQLDLVGHSKSWRMKVEPHAWRRRFGFRGGTDALKKQAVDWMHGKFGVTPRDHNEAEAVCIACWGVFDGCAQLEQELEAERAKARARRARAALEAPP